MVFTGFHSGNPSTAAHPVHAHNSTECEQRESVHSWLWRARGRASRPYYPLAEQQAWTIQRRFSAELHSDDQTCLQQVLLLVSRPRYFLPSPLPRFPGCSFLHQRSDLLSVSQTLHTGASQYLALTLFSNLALSKFLQILIPASLLSCSV